MRNNTQGQLIKINTPTYMLNKTKKSRYDFVNVQPASVLVAPLRAVGRSLPII